MKKTKTTSPALPPSGMTAEDPTAPTAPVRKKAVRKSIALQVDLLPLPAETVAVRPAALESGPAADKTQAVKPRAVKTAAKKAAKSTSAPARVSAPVPEPLEFQLEVEEPVFVTPKTAKKAAKKVAIKKAVPATRTKPAPRPEIPHSASPASSVADSPPRENSLTQAAQGQPKTESIPLPENDVSAGETGSAPSSPPDRERHEPRPPRQTGPPKKRGAPGRKPPTSRSGDAPPDEPATVESPPSENVEIPRGNPSLDSAPGPSSAENQDGNGNRATGNDRDREFQPRSPVPQGPDGEPRRLTKFERWKQRKEKFKQQKQQRYLERTGRLPQGAPGTNGNNSGQPSTPEGGNQERRDQRESRDAREPRTWEPRPPRPEPPLGPPEDCVGLLELTDIKGFGFLRPRDRGYSASPQDPFVSAEIVRQLGLREGVFVEAVMRRGGRGPQVVEVTKVNGLEPTAYRTLPLFEELTAINPNKRYILETASTRNTTRLIDFISPIGRGQRGLIVAPPRAGKTTFLQHIAEAVLEKYVDVKVIVLLVDERPEEVTEISRALPGAEIMASSNDQDPRNHIRMAHLAIERAKRLVEAGQHVFMLLDSITRLARGFNNAMRGGGGGKAMSGGLDSRALEAPRRLFAAARNTREAGSLTIMATALVETNNKGDDLIFQEFKGTGNMELVLDRKISQQYVYPAVDIFKSGTRREELLLPAHQLEKVHLIRRGLSGHRPVEAVERLLQVMGKYPTNNQMLIEIKSRE